MLDGDWSSDVCSSDLDIVHGREVKNREALANPEALELYRNLPALRS
jgi:hypothetical protein